MKKLIRILTLIGCLLLALPPISVGGIFMAHEGVFYFGVLASILSKSRLFSFSYIDRYILLFILLGIVSLGFDIVFGNSWGGFRAFRWHILTPSIIYILIRLNEKKVYSRDILSAFLIGSLFSSFILISNWLQF